LVTFAHLTVKIDQRSRAGQRYLALVDGGSRAILLARPIVMV